MGWSHLICQISPASLIHLIHRIIRILRLSPISRLPRIGRISRERRTGHPKIGDETHLPLWLTLMGTSLVGLIFSVFEIRKTKRNKHIR